MGKKEHWSLLLIKHGLERFHKQHGRYPTASEVDQYEYLPAAKTIERRFGGLVTLRHQLKLTGQSDFRTGAHSTNRAKSIGARAHTVERKVYDFLVARFKKEFVHREYFFTDDHRTRADFFVYDGSNGFCVDVFYPNSVRNLTGCLNDKLGKYAFAHTNKLLPYPVIFLQMNEEIGQDALNALVANKKRTLTANEALMGWEVFQAFCKNRKALAIGGKGGLAIRGSMS